MADVLLDLKGPQNRKLGEMGIIDSEWEKMAHWRKEELGLSDTTVGDNGDFKDNYLWNQNDEMMGAGAIVSTIPDLLKYGKRYLSNDPKYDFLDLCEKSVGTVNDTYDIE